jgi:hypothetical protein
MKYLACMAFVALAACGKQDPAKTTNAASTAVESIAANPSAPASQVLERSKTGIESTAGAESTRVVAAKRAVERVLRDPRSAYYRDIVEVYDVVCGEVNSKNGMGGYAGFHAFIHNSPLRGAPLPNELNMTPRQQDVDLWCRDLPGKQLTLLRKEVDSVKTTCSRAKGASVCADVPRLVAAISLRTQVIDRRRDELRQSQLLWEKLCGADDVKARAVSCERAAKAKAALDAFK